MLLLLPYIITGLGLSLGICSAAAYSGALLAVMLIAWFIVGFVGGFLLFLLLMCLSSLGVDKSKPQPVPAPFYSALVRYVMGLLTTVGRVRVHLRGAETLPAGRYLLVGNHRSAFDPIVTGWVLREQGLVFISKPENFRIPVVGRIIHKAWFLSIDRENDRAALRTILAAVQLLKQDVASVAIYPEGTRNRGEGLLPLHNGAFKIAQKAGTPIAVVAVRGTERIARRAPWRTTDVYLDVCGVLDAETVHQSKTQEIGEVVKEWIINSANT